MSEPYTPGGNVPKGLRGDAEKCFGDGFPNTEEGVRAMLLQDCFYDMREAEYKEDPKDPGCWMVTDHEQKLVLLAYVEPHLEAGEFEELAYEDAKDYIEAAASIDEEGGWS